MLEKIQAAMEEVRKDGLDALRKHQARVAELEAALQMEKLAAARAEGLVVNLPMVLQRIGAVITVDIDGPGKEDGGVRQAHTPNPEEFIERPERPHEYQPEIDGPRGDFRPHAQLDHSAK